MQAAPAQVYTVLLLRTPRKLERTPEQRAPEPAAVYILKGHQQAPAAEPSEQLSLQQQLCQGDEHDPLVTVLLQQVSSLTSDKSKLQVENEQLRRENGQLQELLGYLSTKERGQGRPISVESFDFFDTGSEQQQPGAEK